jgi:hypothetical protein
MGGDALRATSHMRLRAHDHYTSSTLIGGKGGAGFKFASHCARGSNKLCAYKMDLKPWH